VEVMKKNFIIILVLLFLLILISGCINILPILEGDSIAPGKGRLKIYLTDLSENYKANDSENYLAVYITISKIQVHLAGEDGEDEGEWIILRDWSNENESELPIFDLMTLQDVSELLVDGSFDDGKYTQLRLFVTKDSVLIETKSKENKLIEVGTDGEPVEIPSVYQTGIKLIHPFEIVENGETILTIDFDAGKSIVKTGNGSYKLKPVIKVITNISE
jgi:hypothetical protein